MDVSRQYYIGKRTIKIFDILTRTSIFHSIQIQRIGTDNLYLKNAIALAVSSFNPSKHSHSVPICQRMRAFFFQQVPPVTEISLLGGQALQD